MFRGHIEVLEIGDLFFRDRNLRSQMIDFLEKGLLNLDMEGRGKGEGVQNPEG